MTMHERPLAARPRRKLTLVVADDEPEFRRLVAYLTRSNGTFDMIGQAEDGPGALKLVEDLRPDVVLLDFEMPGMDGLQVAGFLRSRFPALRIVLASSQRSEQLGELAASAGANAFIPKVEFCASRLWAACQQGPGSSEGT